MARETRGVLPSGVGFTARAFIGADMELLSTSVADKGALAFNKLIEDCVISIGTDRDITSSKIDNLLSNDRKYLLLFLRQFSLNFKEKFEFTHEWPVTEDGQQKDVTPHSVIIKSFYTKPYIWVQKEIEELKEKGEEFEYEFPEMYQSYKEVLDLNLEQKIILEATGAEFFWEILTGNQENLFANVGKKQRHINLPIQMRKPRVLLKGKKGNKDQLTMYNTSKGDWMDLEQIRKEIRDKEGIIDTSLSIKHPTLEKVAQIDLIGTLAFFVPSQAI